MPPQLTGSVPSVREPLSRLQGDPAALAEALAGMRPAYVADALRALPPEAGAKVMAALPADLAVPVFDEPELAHHRARIFEQMGEEKAAPLIDAMSPDQQADLFRELPAKERPRFLRRLDEPTRGALEFLLRYPSHTAGGIMTTKLVSVPPTWSVQQVLDHVSQVGRDKGIVYAIYSLAPEQGTLGQVVALTDWLVPTART